MAEGLTFDEALTSYVGQFGRGQQLIVAAAALFSIPNAVVSLLWVFVCVDPISVRSWRCTSASHQQCSSVWQAADPHQAFCELPRDQWEWTDYGTVVAKFDLVCSDAWKVQLANSIMFAGCFLGSGLFGYLCDRCGRRKPLLLATAITAAATFASLAAPNYWVMAAARAVVGFGAAGQNQCAFLLCSEVCGPAYRAFANIAVCSMFTVGEFILAALAYTLPNWQHLTIAAGALQAAALLLYPLIPESARWLLSGGKQQEATALVRQLSVANGTRMPGKPLVCSRHSSLDKGSAPAISGSSLSSSRSSMSLDAKAVVVESSSLPVYRQWERKSYYIGPDQNSSQTLQSTPHLDVDKSRSCVALTLSTVLSAELDDNEVSCSAQQSESPNHDTKQEDHSSMLHLLRQPWLAVIFLVLCLSWFVVFLTYYGISLGTGGLPGSIYVTFVLGSVAEGVAVVTAALLVDRAGRHNVLSGGMLVAGVACFAAAYCASHQAQGVLAAAGKFGCAVSLVVLSIYASELFPTPIRATALGLLSQSSRLGSIAAPFMLMLATQLGVGGSAIFLPYVTFGAMSLLSGVLVLTMPETRGASMPETMQDLKNLPTVLTAKPWRQGGFAATMAFMFRTSADSVAAEEAAAAASTAVSQADAGTCAGVMAVITLHVGDAVSMHCSKSAGQNISETDRAAGISQDAKGRGPRA